MSQKKIDKEFCLTDSSVNCYGFRLLTSGYQLAEFQKNPIGYYMHDRGSGVLLKWEDFRTDGDKVYARPVINLSHPRGQQTVDEIENGFLNGASCGHIIVLESSDEPADKEPGQCGPTVTKWFNREGSLVDIPGNFSGLCLYDGEGNAINLAAFSPQKTTLQNPDAMSKLFLTVASLSALGLGAAATEQDAETTIVDLAARNKTLAENLAAANVAKTTAEKALSDYKAAADTEKVKNLLDDATAKGKITADLRADLEKDYAAEPGKLENLLGKMKPYQPITSQLKADGPATGESWEALDRAGKLEDLKASNPEHFKTLFKKRFGTDYKG